MTDQQEHPDAETGPASFCVPRAAITALINAQATAYEIGAYLTLARFTDATGMYSTAAGHAIREYTGANRDIAQKALARLQRIQVPPPSPPTPTPTPRTRTPPPPPPPGTPLVYDLAAWGEATGEILPAPTTRHSIRYVLPAFDEPLEARVWIGGNLVKGLDDVLHRPLKTLKNLGDLAARLLLWAYAVQTETWVGVGPQRFGYRLYACTQDALPSKGGWEWTCWKDDDHQRLSGDTLKLGPWKDWDAHRAEGQPLFAALAALLGAGLLYEVTFVTNRPPRKDPKDNLPVDLEPLYTYSGRPVSREQGLAEDIKATYDALNGRESRFFEGYQGHPVVVRAGQPHSLIGVYRLRCRVVNPRNAGVSDAWRRVRQNDEEGQRMIAEVRRQEKLPPLPVAAGAPGVLTFPTPTPET